MSRPPTDVQRTPAGHTIEFFGAVGADGRPQQRRYLVDGERLPSVTTITGIYDKSRQFVRKALALKDQGLDWYTYVDEAAERGKAAHDLIVRLMADGQAGSLSDIAEAYRPWGQQAAAWLLWREPELLAAERMIVGDGYAGRFDLLCKLDGMVSLVDFKTTKGSPAKYRDGKRVGTYPPYDEAALQLAGYAMALPVSGYPEAEQLLVVRLWPGGHDEIPVPNEPGRFAATLAAYQAKQQTGRDLRAAMKALAA